MESSGGTTVTNWTEAVEDLVHSGEFDEAISLLESTVSKLEGELGKEVSSKITGNPLGSSVADRLYTALHDLSKLYNSQGFSLKADQMLSRALQIKQRKVGLTKLTLSIPDESNKARVSQHKATSPTEDGYGESSTLQNAGLAHQSSDDWEALVDRAPEELLSPQNKAEIPMDDSKGQNTGTKRRGRGTFSYNKLGMYSDYQSNEPELYDSTSDSETNPAPPADRLERNLNIGTRHIVVMTGMPLSTRTTDLEKLLEAFKNNFVIRWVNDTTSLAVFVNPTLAREAINSIKFPFTAHILDGDDELLSSIPTRDLERPCQRPQTNPTTAQRLIARELKIKLPSSTGISEHRKQEAERKHRIFSRQSKRDEAWGSEDENDEKSH